MRKLFWSFFFVILLALIGFYFYQNDSYRKSIEAKYYYLKGDYKKAYILSREAFDLDPYNKMAFTIMTQSKISAKYQEYIEEGRNFLDKIKAISEKPSITKADKTKIKMMCETMMERYKNISPTVLTDKSLVKEAMKTYRQFEQIYEDLFQK